ncbi:MAG: hypothetical protein QOH22_351, partial [Gemmatimonadaceae bacterium]|nr:hypothetical protein [Gemmatimonadaceae bacterium]
RREERGLITLTRGESALAAAAAAMRAAPNQLQLPSPHTLFAPPLWVGNWPHI